MKHVKSHQLGTSVVSRSDAGRFQHAFFDRVGDLDSFLAILNQLPNSFFFIKDEHSRMVWASRGAQERINPGGGSVVGTTDYDFFPKYVADSFVADDQSVIRTGRPLIGRTEVYFNAAHELSWSVATKFPVMDKLGKRIGIIGWVTTHAGQQPVRVADPRVSRAIEFIEHHAGQSFSVEDVAGAVSLSSRQLLRIFRQTMGIGIQQFMMKVRIQAASDALLVPGATATAAAMDFGFCDQSSFTRQFRQQMGMTPAAFQLRYASAHHSDLGSGQNHSSFPG